MSFMKVTREGLLSALFTAIFQAFDAYSLFMFVCVLNVCVRGRSKHTKRSQVYSSITFYLSSWGNISLNLELTNLARLAGQSDPGICFSLFLCLSSGVTSMLCHTWFFYMYAGSLSSCSHENTLPTKLFSEILSA